MAKKSPAKKLLSKNPNTGFSAAMKAIGKSVFDSFPSDDIDVPSPGGLVKTEDFIDDDIDITPKEKEDLIEDKKVDNKVINIIGKISDLVVSGDEIPADLRSELTIVVDSLDQRMKIFDKLKNVVLLQSLAVLARNQFLVDTTLNKILESTVAGDKVCMDLESLLGVANYISKRNNDIDRSLRLGTSSLGNIAAMLDEVDNHVKSKKEAIQQETLANTTTHGREVVRKILENIANHSNV